MRPSRVTPIDRQHQTNRQVSRFAPVFRGVLLSLTLASLLLSACQPSTVLTTSPEAKAPASTATVSATLLPSSTATEAPTGTATSSPTVSQTWSPPEKSSPLPSATATRTPYRSPTITPTPPDYELTYNEEGTPLAITWGDYPGPSKWPSTAVPPPVFSRSIPDEQVNILLLGNDYHHSWGRRTDAIMLLSLNRRAGTASVISFPRDLYVYVPGYTMARINTVLPLGGLDLLASTFEYNFGLRPDFYVNVNVFVFTDMVDMLEGIDVQVAKALSDPTYAGGRFSVDPGLVHMDGVMARWYVRSRKTSSDIDRARRQQEVLEAIFKRVISLDGILRAPELYALFRQNVETDLRLGDILPLLPLAARLVDTSRVRRYTIGYNQVIEWRTPEGAQVLLPRYDRILPILDEALQP